MENYKNLKEKFEVVWNTKHKDDIKMVLKVPTGNNKKWWEFWKKQSKPKRTIIELMDRYKEEDNFDENSEEIFIPVKNSK